MLVAGSGGDDRGAFASLLGAQAPQQFFATTWERDVALHRGAFPDAARLLTLEQLEILIASAAAAPGGRLNVVAGIARPLAEHASEAAAVAAVFRAYSAGQTLLVTDLQRHWPPIARLCRALEAEALELGLRLALPIGANAYLTRARSQGFDIHYDDHCVFIVQVAGTKQWQAYAPRQELPVERCAGPIAAADLGPPVLEAILQPGDVLYLPRGFPHAARTGHEHSLHVTVSLHTLTWLTLVVAALRDVPALRRSVPSALPPGATQAYFDTGLRGPATVVGLDAHAERQAAALVAQLVPQPRGRLAAIAALDAAPLDPHTRVRRVQGAPCAVLRDADHVAMQIPGTTLRLPAVMADALAFIARTPVFCGAELPQARAAFDPVDLVQLLIKEGLLELVPGPCEGGAL